jgi:glycosyltransferase involved in cell wall biosynthesis
MPLRVLTFSSLYPSAAQPRHGIFVEARLTNLLRDCEIDSRVIAPVPWFPLRSKVFGRYAKFAATPKHESRMGIAVAHPRYLMLPTIGVPWQPDSMARGALPELKRLRASGWTPQLIDAHYFYPDGVAAALLAQRLQVPVVITARGSDINLLAQTPAIRQRIVWAAGRAAAVVAVSAQLRGALIALGVDRDKVVVLRNGIDLDRFKPQPRDASRTRLGLAQRATVVCIGNLRPEKGFTLAVECLRHLDGVQLLIVGEGPEQETLRNACRGAGVADRVVFKTTMTQDELQYAYSCADVLLLTSTREGWPNVLLEAMACGTPVAAVDVGAVADMVTDGEVGRVVRGRDPVEFARAVQQLIAAPPSRERLRQHAARFDWRSISIAQHTLFQRCLDNSRDTATRVAFGAERTAA